jgi:hypothetical protein
MQDHIGKVLIALVLGGLINRYVLRAFIPQTGVTLKPR